jgi:transglutaminase-like putative cysteine protease
MFVFFPRVAPLWSVPLPDAAARTGISDSMTPGEIAQLGRSDELAFRAEFDGEVPLQSELYWRALTFSHYEDGTWSGGRMPNPERIGEKIIEYADIERSDQAWLRDLELGSRRLEYSVIVEPTYKPWLFALDFAEPVTPRIGIGRDYRLVAVDPVTSRSRYEVVSHAGTDLDPSLPDWLRSRELRLPPDGNLRARAFVLDLVDQGYWGGALAERLLQHFRSEPYFYTLSPPTLAGDRIDQFLFETRRGFCAHYAGAFVFMMRQAGVPARVVAGYQGGELNPLASHLIVRQYDAHAWAEIWLEGAGWVRVDPTAAVAPDRIERGAEAAFGSSSEAGDSPFIPEGIRSLTWVMDALYYLDSLEYRWNVLVLSYDANRQSELLTDLLGEVTPTRIAVAVTMAGALAIGLAGLGTLLGAWRDRRTPLLRLHDGFAATFSAAGLPRAPEESPRRYAERLVAAWPALEADIRLIAGQLDASLFDPAAEEAELAPLERRLWSLRGRLALARLRGTFDRRVPERS